MRRLTLLVLLLVTADLTLWSAVVPLLPHYRASLHLTTTQVGLVLAAFSAAVVVVAVPAGHLADRLGARAVTAAGVAMLAAATASLGLAGDFRELLAARVFQGAADAVVWTAGIAWVAAATPPLQRGRVIAVVEGGATVGIIAGPLVGGVATSLVGISVTFLGAAALLLVLLVWTLLEPPAAVRGAGGSRLADSLRASVREPVIAAAMAMILLVSVVGATLQLLVPLRLADLGFGRSGIGLVFTAAAVIGTGCTVLSGRGGDRVGRLPLAIAACAGLAVTAALLALPSGRAPFVAVVVAAAGVQSVLYAVGYPLGADGADRARIGHGVVQGIVNLVWGVGAVVGPVAGARLAQSAGTDVSYLVLAALCLVAAGGLERARRVAAAAGAGV
ncbi:MAG TPA: MFS transporter [Gaiellales bacterium]|nr:MFS transporter [Gaiellales bacterium]